MFDRKSPSPAAVTTITEAPSRPVRREIAQLLDELRTVSDERLPEVRERLDALLDAVGQTGNAYVDGVKRTATVYYDDTITIA